jgi:hypothetical protein
MKEKEQEDCGGLVDLRRKEEKWRKKKKTSCKRIVFTSKMHKTKG